LGTAPVGAAATLNLGGLAPGAQYALRYYYRQYDAGDAPTRPVQFVFNGNGANTVFQTDEDVGGAFYLEYDFTAAGGSVSLTLNDESALANLGPMLYAITLQQTVPLVILQYSVSGKNLTLYWNAGLTNYILESSSAISPAQWTPMAGVTNNSVTIPETAPAQFFRLHVQ
jgi:hypothetical protein